MKTMTTRHSPALDAIVADMRRIFGGRLEAVVAYGERDRRPATSLVLVRTLTLEDLDACAARAAAWRKMGAAIPLLLTRAEFVRSLDAFPIEYGEILASHAVIEGDDPFRGLSIAAADLRRACEIQVKSHLLHLREDYIEAGGRRGEIEAVTRESAPGFAVVLRLIARLDGRDDPLAEYAAHRIGLDPRVVSDLLALSDPDAMPAVDPVKLFPAYLSAMERLAEFVDGWRAA